MLNRAGNDVIRKWLFLDDCFGDGWWMWRKFCPQKIFAAQKLSATVRRRIGRFTFNISFQAIVFVLVMSSLRQVPRNDKFWFFKRPLCWDWGTGAGRVHYCFVLIMHNVLFYPCCIVCLVDVAHLERNKGGGAEVSQSQGNCHHLICWGSELLLHHGTMHVTSIRNEGAMRSIEPLTAGTQQPGGCSLTWEQSWRLVTFRTFHQSDERTMSPGHDLIKYNQSVFSRSVFTKHVFFKLSFGKCIFWCVFFWSVFFGSLIFWKCIFESVFLKCIECIFWTTK